MDERERRERAGEEQDSQKKKTCRSFPPLAPAAGIRRRSVIINGRLGEEF